MLSTWTDLFTQRFYALTGLQPFFYTINFVHLLKVFATLGSANFHYLELSSLDQPLQSKGINSKASNPLEEILEKIPESKPSTKKLNPAKNPSLEWITVQVSVTVKKATEAKYG